MGPPILKRSVSPVPSLLSSVQHSELIQKRTRNGACQYNFGGILNKKVIIQQYSVNGNVISVRMVGGN